MENREAERWREGEMKKHTERWRDANMDRWRDGEQRVRETEKHTYGETMRRRGRGWNRPRDR